MVEARRRKFRARLSLTESSLGGWGVGKDGGGVDGVDGVGGRCGRWEGARRWGRVWMVWEVGGHSDAIVMLFNV